MGTPWWTQGGSDLHQSVPITLPLPGDGAPRWTCLRPGAKVSGSQPDLLTPWYDGRAEIIPFRYLPVLLGGKGTSHVGWDTGGLPSQGKKLRASNPTRPMFPQRRNACGASVPPHPLGVVRSQSRGLASSSSCRSACGACTKFDWRKKEIEGEREILPHQRTARVLPHQWPLVVTFGGCRV